jgi:hypothetical protein
MYKDVLECKIPYSVSIESANVYLQGINNLTETKLVLVLFQNLNITIK